MVKDGGPEGLLSFRQVTNHQRPFTNFPRKKIGPEPNPLPFVQKVEQLTPSLNTGIDEPGILWSILHRVMCVV